MHPPSYSHRPPLANAGISIFLSRGLKELSQSPDPDPWCNAQKMRHHLPILWVPLVLASAMAGAQPPVFEHSVIDPANPADPHCKTLGDFSGDGLLDAVAASSSGDGMYWYEYPLWTKHEIRASGSWTTDMQAGDIDGDGDDDIVIPNSSGLQWYENPLPLGDPRTDTWTEHPVGPAGANNHDVELADIDDDMDLDIVTRRKTGAGTFFWRQVNPTSWTMITIDSAAGEGIAIGDIDGDDDLDVAQNRTWVEQVSPTNWVSHSVDPGAPTDTGVVIADIDGNGDADIVIGPSESVGEFVWYSAADPENGPWTKHTIDATTAFLHTFKAVDIDDDLDLDLVTAEMHQSSDPDEVSVYLNSNSGSTWAQQIVAGSGSHNIRIGDIGNDGDIDIFGANWDDSAPNSAVIEIWEQVDPGPLPLDLWRRHILETDLPWNAVFVDAADLTGDGLPDLVTGGWWYPNPGDLGDPWVRTTIGAPLNNMAVLFDFDGDEDIDILGTDGQVNGEGFSWGRNNGGGTFTNFPITNTATGGDFLQGVAVGDIILGGGDEVVLSWHNGGAGTSMFSVPADPTTAVWPITTISATTNSEQVALGNFDGDLDTDIHLGDNWLRQNANGTFTALPGVTLTSGVPDRVVAANVDSESDGDLDVVIGVEFSNRLVWGENSSNGGTWTEHLIATDIDYFSVDTADLDGDGDTDVVGGAHMGNGEVFVYENDGFGTTWMTHTVDSGNSSVIDHHDGTQLIDLDLDGDLDIVSVGWTLRSLVVYENLAIDDGNGDLTPPVIQTVVALGDPNSVIVDFSEALDPVTAEDDSNYTISHGVTVDGATLGVNQRTVTLTTSTLSEGVTYTLTVNDVEDEAGNVILADSEAEFSYIDVDPEAGLVAWWPLDEGNGTLTVDASGNGHNGLLVNGPEWTKGPALDFDGADDYVDTGTFDVPGTSLTLAAWIQPQDLQNCPANDCRILAKATGTAEDAHIFMLSTIDQGGADRLRFRLKTGGTTTTLIGSSGDLVEDEWVHAAAVYDGSTMTLYLDAVSIGSTSKTGSLALDDTVPVWIGGSPGGASERPWDGLIDDVRIYDRALSAGEILSLPGPSQSAIFSDGFESGDLSAWSNSVP